MNPVKATLKQYQGQKLVDNLISINNTCNEICVAFGHDDQFSSCRQECGKMVDEIKKDKYGYDYRALQSPVVWDLSLHYLPSLLEKGMSTEEAREACLKACKNSSDPIKCSSNCELDYNAVQIEGFVAPKEPVVIENEETYASPCGCPCQAQMVQIPTDTPTDTPKEPVKRRRRRRGMGWIFIFILFMLISVMIVKCKKL